MKIFNLLASNIENLELKLEGKLPINRDELLALASSWGRNDWFYTRDKDNNSIEIKPCKLKEKYNLSKLDVSKITNFNDIFRYSYFNENINSWDISNGISMDYIFYKANNFNQPLNSWNTLNVTSMVYMFGYTKEFNQPLDKWDVSNVTNMCFMFYGTKKFNQDLNSWNILKVKNMSYMFKDAETFSQPILWDLSNIKSCRNMFYNAKVFENKFNKGNPLPYEIDEIKEWLIDNRDRMIAIDIEHSKGKELNNFLLNLNDINDVNI